MVIVTHRYKCVVYKCHHRDHHLLAAVSTVTAVAAVASGTFPVINVNYLLLRENTLLQTTTSHGLPKGSEDACIHVPTGIIVYMYLQVNPRVSDTPEGP